MRICCWRCHNTIYDTRLHIVVIYTSNRHTVHTGQFIAIYSLRYSVNKRIAVSDEFIVHCASKRTWALCGVRMYMPANINISHQHHRRRRPWNHETAVMCVFPRKFIFTTCWRLIDCYCICVEISEESWREKEKKTVKKTNELKTLSFRRFVFIYARHFLFFSPFFFLLSFILNCVLCTRILVHLMTERSHNVARASLCTQFIGSKVFMCVRVCVILSALGRERGVAAQALRNLIVCQLGKPQWQTKTMWLLNYSHELLFIKFSNGRETGGRSSGRSWNSRQILLFFPPFFQHNFISTVGAASLICNK